MAMQRPGPFVTGRIRLARPEIRLFVPADTALRTGASYAPDHRRPLPFVDKQETTMTTKNRLFALAAATFTASLVAGTASARPPVRQRHQQGAHSLDPRPLRCPTYQPGW